MLSSEIALKNNHYYYYYYYVERPIFYLNDVHKKNMEVWVENLVNGEALAFEKNICR